MCIMCVCEYLVKSLTFKYLKISISSFIVDRVMVFLIGKIPILIL